MTTTASVTVWPTTAAALQELLAIDLPAAKAKCHGQTKKHHRCENPISQSTCADVARLLDQIVTHESFKAAQSLLKQVAYMIMCKGVHQRYKHDRHHFDIWEGNFGLLQSLAAKVEDQDDSSPEEKTIDIPPTTPPRRVSRQHVGVKDETPGCTSTSKPHQPSPTASSKTTTPSKNTPPKHKFEPYGPTRSTISINKTVKKLILRPLLETETYSGGNVYVYTFPENYRDVAPCLKIGNAKDVPDRMKAWKAQCGYEPQILSQFKADNYVKVENLVHAQLYNQRRRETGCPTCDVRHKEWFDVSSMTASQSSSLWATWTRLQPYDDEGNLKDEWRARVEAVDLSDPNCWDLFVNAVYDDDVESELSEGDENELLEEERMWSSDDQTQYSDDDSVYDTDDENDCNKSTDDEER
ncbi:hypothetical protein FALBO_8544 [Fusarium albosuccineum]|uniref:Bacteriophage T5 Orf172 DNA-binding domain-containing protein n=1 Tax=Fusarium albosuccineum TaxID=1237068 RepID=A0A8H4L9B4_9HYPO|nr:hypothetical protein FALBO_8544 [Fusarium albosuccineum]